MVSITRFRKDERHKQQHELWWETTSEKSCVWDTEHAVQFCRTKAEQTSRLYLCHQSGAAGCRCLRGDVPQVFPPQQHSLWPWGRSSAGLGGHWHPPAHPCSGHSCPQSSHWPGARWAWFFSSWISIEHYLRSSKNIKPFLKRFLIKIQPVQINHVRVLHMGKLSLSYA